MDTVNHQPDIAGASTQGELFNCGECSRRFGTRQRYNQHVKTHTKPFRCDDCSKGFALRTDLARHVQARHRLQHMRFPCSYSGCMFKATRKDNLRQHEKKFHQQSMHAPLEKLSYDSISIPGFVGTSFHHHDLLAAASTGNVGFLIMLVDMGFDINQKSDDGSTALHAAARAGREEVIDILITRGANIDEPNGAVRTPLLEAAVGEHHRTVATLLAHGAAPSTTDRNKRSLLHYLLRSTKPEMTELLIRQLDIFGPTEQEAPILYEAAKAGRADIVTIMISKYNCDVNKFFASGLTALHVAARCDRVEVVALLFKEESLDVNVFSRIVGVRRLSPLHYAARKGNASVVEQLLRRDDLLINTSNSYGASPLIYAARFGHRDVVWLLLADERIDVNHADRWGETALHEAVREDSEEIVALLLSHGGINVEIRSKFGKKTALGLARLWGHKQEIIDLLLAHGAVDEASDRQAQNDQIIDTNETETIDHGYPEFESTDDGDLSPSADHDGEYPWHLLED